jgi:tRNA pseudouridine38-40 synthase
MRNVYEAGIEKKGAFTVFRIVANSFLPHQVRSTVGLLIRLGLGKISTADFRDIMEARSVGLAGPVSPACGLCLTRVNYPGPLGS